MSATLVRPRPANNGRHNIDDISEWQFDCQLLRWSWLFPDERYQRPADQAFVRKTVEDFDRMMVSTLDVSYRGNHKYAIMDGRQRHEVLGHLDWKTVWCCVFKGLTLADEARFFLKRARDRRGVHPYYQFNARVLSGEAEAKKINRIVRGANFKLHTSAGPDDYIAAISAVEAAWGYRSEHRSESLTPSMHVISKALRGRERGKDGNMIKGLGRFFQAYPDSDINYRLLVSVLKHQGAVDILSVARERKRAGSPQPISFEVADVLVKYYNRGINGKKPASRLSKSALIEYSHIR